MLRPPPRTPCSCTPLTPPSPIPPQDGRRAWTGIGATPGVVERAGPPRWSGQDPQAVPRVAPEARRSGFDGPGPARGEEAGEVAGAAALVGLEELTVQGGAVLGTLDGPEDADGRGLVGAPGQATELEGQPRFVPALVVDQQRVLTDLGHLSHAQAAVGLHDDTVLELSTEADGL